MKSGKTAVRILAAFFIAAAGFFASSCAAVKPTTKNMELMPDSSQGSVVVVRITDSGSATRIGEPKAFEILIDGTAVETIDKNQRLKLLVPNGSHTISVKANDRIVSSEITFTANSNESLFHVYFLNGATLALEDMNYR